MHMTHIDQRDAFLIRFVVTTTQWAQDEGMKNEKKQDGIRRSGGGGEAGGASARL
jgi:hypothetical protein